ncbi:MAG: hypothetical protein K6D91_06060 [Prevotella sp.]|nr:hypothetical protein [Prevotella sp.]
MNEKQQQLIFDRGITNIPSDATCSDNELSSSENLIYVDGEHRLIRQPVEILSPGSELLFVHKFNNEKVYIYKSVGVYIYSNGIDTLSLVIGDNEVGVGVSDKISAIGKILIISQPTGLLYFIYNNGSYVGYDGIPAPEFEFALGGSSVVTSTFLSHGFFDFDVLGNVSGVAAGQQDSFNNELIALYGENLDKVAKAKGFANPFFVRGAVELFDGTFAMITQPYPLFPSVTRNGVFFVSYNNSTPDQLRTYYARLKYKQYTDYTDWSDIVKGVVLFVSKGVDILDKDGDQPFDRAMWDENNKPLYHDYIGLGNGNLMKWQKDFAVNSSEAHTNNAGAVWNGVSYGLKRRNSSDVLRDLKEVSVFYKLADIGRGMITEWSSSYVDEISPYHLVNIEAQTQLGADDYFSRSKISAEYIYSFNSRLLLANVKRDIFRGFNRFLSWDNDTNASYRFFVTLKTDNGNIVVGRLTSTKQKQGVYFFYPDSRATHVDIFKGDTLILSKNLKEHPSLNGAYYFAYPEEAYVETGNVEQRPQTDVGASEYLSNFILQSEVNNPFVLPARGYIRVGTGFVLGMVSNTQALSQGQFGEHPLYVFSDSGVWSAIFDSEGWFTNVIPDNREVCNNPLSITQTDDAVFFSTAKGLMKLVGKDAICVSEQLQGTDFNEKLKNALIAYDYKSSLLWILSTTGVRKDYVYSLKAGTFGTVNTKPFGAVVNDYPDTLLSENGTYKVYSLLEKDDISTSSETGNAQLVSRPLKLENAFALKSIMQIKHVMSLSEGASLNFTIEASNNLKDWVQLSSLRGTPWKYYRFTYAFQNLSVRDTFAGTVLITQERRVNRLR